MNIFQIAKNKFAIGTFGKRAKYVVKAAGKKVTGVRGVRPMLDKRYSKVSPPAAVRTALKAALA